MKSGTFVYLKQQVSRFEEILKNMALPLVLFFMTAYRNNILLEGL